MTHFADLTPYRYGFGPLGWDAEGPRAAGLAGLYGWRWSDDGAFELPELSVGWLQPPHDFPRGAVAPERVARLEERCLQSRYHVMRGYFICRFCDERVEHLGSKEIRLLGDGVVYAAPNLVAHYVAAHGYLPPSGFVEALRKETPPPEPNPRLRRPVLIGMVPRGEVDASSLEAEVRELQRRRHREGKFPMLSITRDGEDFHIVASVDLVRDGGQLVSKVWKLPSSAFLNLEQASFGVSSMLESVYSEHVLALAPWKR